MRGQITTDDLSRRKSKKSRMLITFVARASW